MKTFLWTLQILFGVLFFFHDIALLVQPAPMHDMLEMLPYPSGFLLFIGVCEILGGLGLILPMWTGIAQWLIPLAAPVSPSSWLGLYGRILQTKKTLKPASPCSSLYCWSWAPAPDGRSVHIRDAGETYGAEHIPPADRRRQWPALIG